MKWCLKDAARGTFCRGRASVLPPQHRTQIALLGRRHCASTIRNRALPWQRKAVDPGPPRPDARFTREDLKRIKREGPKMEDITAHVAVDDVDFRGEVSHREYVFVPPQVLGDWYTSRTVEPRWGRVAEKPLNLFLQGLRQRNWTSEYYDPNSCKWVIEIWKDSGRFARPSFPGYRAVVTPTDGTPQFWVDMPRPGLPTNLETHIGGASLGGIWNWPRTPIYTGVPSDVGYNQIFEELFEAFEEHVPASARETFAREQRNGIERDRLGMDTRYERFNPAVNHISLDYRQTAQEWSVRGPIEAMPNFLVQASVMSFVFVVTLIGVLKRRKREPADLQEALEFAQSKAKARKDATTGVTLADVAGLDSVKHEFQEIVAFLRDPEHFARSGVRPPKGVLLEGPPGTGKTLIARAIAGEAAVGFYQMSGSEFVEAIVGVGAARVRDLFRRARAYTEPTLIFVDEIDALALRRARGSQQANEEREQTLNQLLTEIDGFNPTTGVVFIAATNRSSLLDPALMRAGRFDRKVTVPRPDAPARAAILAVHARKHPLAPSVDLVQLARDVPGLVGADLAALLNQAALLAVRDGATEVNEGHIQDATDRILRGDRKPSFSLDTPLGVSLGRAFAAHEAGRAVAAADLRARTGLVDDVEKVSVVRRGASYTRTVYERRDDDDYLFSTRAQLMARMHLVLAGHAAEEVLGFDPSTYAADDVARASVLAELIVQNYSLSELGLTTFASVPAFPRGYQEGRPDVSDLFERMALQATAARDLAPPSGPMLVKLESARSKLVREAYAETKARLIALRPALVRVADELYRDREVPGSRVKAILAEEGGGGGGGGSGESGGGSDHSGSGEGADVRER